jgi:hypothetical protein
MTEPYSETVGTRSGPYEVNQAIMRICPNCGAPEGVRCTVDLGGRLVGRHYRRIPCLARLTGRRCAS